MSKESQAKLDAKIIEKRKSEAAAVAKSRGHLLGAWRLVDRQLVAVCEGCGGELVMSGARFGLVTGAAVRVEYCSKKKKTKTT